MSPTPPSANVLPLRPRDHEDAARGAITWLVERHRKVDDWRPEGLENDAEDGHRERSGAIHPFTRLRETQVLARVRPALAGAAAMKLHAENKREVRFVFERHAMEVIARRWSIDHGIAPTWAARRPPTSS